MPVLALTFFALTVAEIWVLIKVGGVLGAGDTIVLMIVVSLVGAWLVKRQGVSILRRISAEVASARVPGRELVDGALVLVAAVMLLTPGLITDAAALLLLLPPVRAGMRAWGTRWFARQVRLAAEGKQSRVVFRWDASAGGPWEPPIDVDGRERGGPEDPPPLGAGEDPPRE